MRDGFNSLSAVDAGWPAVDICSVQKQTEEMTYETSCGSAGALLLLLHNLVHTLHFIILQ